MASPAQTRRSRNVTGVSVLLRRIDRRASKECVTEVKEGRREGQKNDLVREIQRQQTFTLCREMIR